MIIKTAIICIVLAVNFVDSSEAQQKPQIVSVNGYNGRKLLYNLYSTYKNYFFLLSIASVRAYGKNIRKILDDLRDRMHMDMTETMGIPRLDPLTIDRLKINEEDTELG